MSTEIAADTDALRKQAFSPYIAKMTSASNALKDALDSNADAVPEIRCSTDDQISTLLTKFTPISKTVMANLAAITEGGAEGITKLASLFEELEEVNQEMSFTSDDDDDDIYKNTYTNTVA